MANTAVTASIIILLAFPALPWGEGKVLSYLREISGNRTVGGVHNDRKSGGVSYYTDRVKAATGKVPGLWGGDFSYDGRISNRWEMIYEAERQWKAGALVNLMWHACPPTAAEPCSWEGDIHSKLSDAQWKDLVTEGGALNRVWKQRMDRILPYLEYLEDRGVEVLWRPHHEMNQGNFWWGGRPGKDGTSRLFQVTHDYMTRVKGLRNLVWTWDVQDLRFDWGDYHPGAEYFDVMALDMYEMGYTDSLYRSMLRLAEGKPIALGEVQKMPSPAVLEKYPLYTFVMGWAYMTVEDNSVQALNELFNAYRVLTRDEMPGWDRVSVSATFAGRPGYAADGLEISLASGRLTIRLPEHDRAIIRLISSDGRIVGSPALQGGWAEVETGSLPPGVYTLHGAWAGHAVSRKLVLGVR